MFDLSGKVALVTGAGQGMGVGMARALARQGAAVAVNDFYAERADSTTEVITREGGRAFRTPFDVTDRAAVDEAIRQIEMQAGPVDILVNNAGIPAEQKGKGRMGQFRESTPEDWKPYIDLNLYGSLFTIHAVINGMCLRKAGRIIQISSGSGRNGLKYGISIYGASKSGIEGFIRHLSQEVGPEGVTANTVALGRMNNAGGADGLELPVGRFGTPEDAGALVAFLASDEASFLTGQTIGINGGRFTN